MKNGIIDAGTPDEVKYVTKWRFKPFFPFICKVTVVYQKIDGTWVEFADYLQ